MFTIVMDFCLVTHLIESINIYIYIYIYIYRLGQVRLCYVISYSIG